MSGSYDRMLSRPVPVHWAGWESNTATLHACGWDIAADYRVDRDTYGLIMRHQALKLYAVTDYIEFRRGSNFLSNVVDPRHELPRFTVVHVAPNFHTVTMPGLDFSRYQQIDPRPQMSVSRITRVEDFNIFALARAPEKEIVIEGADMSVIEHLEAIQKLQAPKQRELRDRMQREQAAQRIEVVASVVRMAA